MKLFPIIVLAFAYAHANSIARGGWTPGQEYLYRFESQVLTGIPDINKSHYSGVKLTAQAKVQAQNDYTLRIKLDQVKFMTLNGEIDLNEANRIIQNGGPRSGAKEQLPAEFKQLLETAMEVHLKKGRVEKFTMMANEPVAVTNIKRSLLAQLQLDVSGAQLGETESNLINVGAPVDVKMPFYSVVEQSLHGRCRTNYNVNPLTAARALELEQEWAKEETNARLAPSNGARVGCAGKRYYEVIRTRDLNSCDFRPVYQKVSGADVNIDVARTNAGNLMSHVDSTTTTICGDLSSFIVRKIVVDDAFVSNPIGYNTKQTLKSSARIMIELMEKRPIQSPIQLPSQHFFSQSLEYAYPRNGHVSADVARQTFEVMGTYPILPQPGLLDPPSVLVPVKLDRQAIIPKAVEEIKKIAQEMYSNPENIRAEEDISGKIMTIATYMEMMGMTELETIWTQCVAGSSNEVQKITKELLLDTIAMVGTNPATMFVLKKVEASEVVAFKSVFALQSAIKSIKTPTNELLRQFINKIQQWKRVNTAEKQSLLTSALLQVSNLFYHAYVNPETMVSNYPVRIYGVFGTRHSAILTNEYIPALKQILEESRQSQNRHLEMVAITALGKLGHHDATKILVTVAEGAHQEQPMVRSLAVHSMKRTAKRNPDMLINVLLAIINNQQEVPEVRIAALSILPWAQPRYSELQEIAVRSWVEPSRQVASFAKSMLMNLQYTQEPELKHIALKVKNILHLLKPTRHGLQYSKHFDLSNFVEYLLASVSSRVSITNSKVEPAPSKIEMTTDMYLETLGEGLKLRTHSFKLYSQGFEMLIDEVLNRYSDYQVASPEVKAEIQKIAQMINLKKITRPSQAMAFVQHNLIGYEYAAAINYEHVLPALQKIKQAFAGGAKKGRYASVTNLVSMEVFGMNEAGFPIAGRIDNPSVFAVSAGMEADSSLSGGKAEVRPFWSGKVQSDIAVISPFTNEAVSTGVCMSAQVAIPFEAKLEWRRGEVDLTLRVPEATKRSGKKVEMIHMRVLPYTARKDVKTLEPMTQCQDLKKIVSGQPLKMFQQEFEGVVKGNIKTESDNDLVDFPSYWEKIRQHNLPSLFTLGPLMSSIRMSSLKLAIEPAMSQEIDIKLKLWARQTPYAQIAHPIGAQPIQDIKSKGMVSVEKSLESLNGAPATVIKVEAAVKQQNSVVKSYEAYAAFGAKMANPWQIKPVFAAYQKTSQASQPRGIDFGGNLYLTKFKARWNIDDLIQQAPELTLNAKAHYGQEGQQKLITLHTKLTRTEQQVQSLRASPEFKRCEQLARQERSLAPICIKVRQQAGSYDQAEVSLHVPQQLTQSHYLRMVERLFQMQFWANYRPIIPRPQVPSGKLDLVFNVERAGNVAHVKVEHAKDAYRLRNVRIPYLIQGVFPISGRVNLLEWLEQKATLNMAPASCRVEPGHITTFDNVTYSYNIPNCEHVLMMDGSQTYPVAVLAQNTTRQEMIVKILAGKDKIQIGSSSRGTEVLINGQHKTIYPGQKVDHYAQDQRYPSGAGRLVATIRRYNNEDVYYVYVAQHGLKVVTDGKRVEVISPQFLHRRTVGLCGNLDGERIACVKSPGQCAMRPTLAAMSYMLNENGRCSVQSVFPRQFAEYQKELNHCHKDQDVPTPITPIFENSLSGNGVFGFGSGHGHTFGGENWNTAKFGGAGNGNPSGRTEEFGGKKWGMGISGGAPLGGAQDCKSRGWHCSSQAECCAGLVCAKRYTLFGPRECKLPGPGSALGSGRTEEFGGKKMGMGISGGAPLGGAQNCKSRGWHCSSQAECCTGLVCAKRYTLFGPRECKFPGPGSALGSGRGY